MELRSIVQNDWITITLISCVMVIAIARWFSTFHISDLLSSYFKNRFIKLSRNTDDGSSVLILSSVMVYTINLSLFIYLCYKTQNHQKVELNGFILTLTFVTVFILARHFVGKLIATLCDFEELLYAIDHQRGIYRAMFAYALLIINFMIIYATNFNATVLLASLTAIALVLFIYNLILIYTHRRRLLSSNFYFILYLCTLEFAPYLLLYKYFML